MPIILKNLAQVYLPPEHRAEVLGMFFHEGRDGSSIKNYKYDSKTGYAYLPLNQRKLLYVSRLLGEEVLDDRSAGAEVSSPFVENTKFKFRDHQSIPAFNLLEFTKNNNYSVLQAPCSCGKTVVMTWVAGNLGKKVLILVDMGSLQSQWAEAFELVWNKKVQIIANSDTEFADVCVATFQMLHFNPDLVKLVRKEFGTLLLDEWHATSSGTRREILMQMNNMYRIGCTATPYKKGYSDEVLSDMVADVSVEMIDDKALKAEVYFEPTGTRFYSSNPDDFGKIQSKLGKDEKRNLMVALFAAQQVKDGKQVLVVCVTIESVEAVAKILNNYPECKLRVYIGSTKLKEDQALRDDLASGKINVVITVRKADKGLDLPSLDCLILARPANNEAFVTQIAGRIVRPVEGKATPVIYDFVDSSELAVRFATNRRRWYKKLGYVIQKDIDK